MPDGTIGIVEREKQAKENRRRARIRKAALKRREGPIYEDGSFAVKGGRTFDPETGKVRKRVRLPEYAKRETERQQKRLHQHDRVEERKAREASARLMKEEQSKRLVEAGENLRKKVRGDLKRASTPTFKELERRRDAKKVSQIAGALPFVDEGDVKEAESAVIGIPAGLYEVGKALTLDVVKPRKGPLSFDSRTADIAKDVGKATYRDIRHPLRNPLMTGLTVSGLAGVGAGTAARGAAAASAAKTGGLKAAAKAAATRPRPGVRVHTYEGQPIRGRYSTAASARAVQKLNDRRTGGKIGARKAERLLSEERRITDAAAKAPHLRVLADAPRLDKSRAAKLVSRYRKFDGTVQDMAIRVAAEGVPLDDVIEAHIRAASQIEVRLKNRKRGGNPPLGRASGVSTQQAFRLGGERKELLRKAALLEESRKYLDDVDGKPVVKPELERSYKLTRESALVREGRAKRIGVLSLEAAERRKHAPGRMNIKTVSGGRAIREDRPRTLPEAETELGKLEAKIDRIVGPLIERHYQENLDSWQFAAKARRGKAKTGKQLPPGVQPIRYRGGQINIQRTGELTEYVDDLSDKANRMQKAPDSPRGLAEADFWDRIARSNHPTAERLKAMTSEAYELQEKIAKHREPGWMRDAGAELPDLGTVAEFKRFEDVEPFIGGDFRVPDVLRSKRLPHGPTAYRGGVPRKPGTLTHEYTGALRRSGKYTPHTRRAVAEDALEFERYASVERFRQRLLPMGQKVRPPDIVRRGRSDTVYVPLRERQLSRKEAQTLRKTLEDVNPEILTPDEAVRVEQAIKAFEEELFPPVERYAGVRPGEAVPGVVWVDRTLLGSQRKLVGNLPVYDVTADAVKGLILYGKPGYVTPNLLGNIALNLFQQGPLAPANWMRVAKLPRDVRHLVKEVMGHGFSRALAEGTRSPISNAVQKAGNFWSYFVDNLFREAAFVHEARKLGYHSADDIRRFIMDSRHRAEYAEAAQRARDAIIDYERLGPIERDLVRRVLFVYPWVKGSTYYAAQFLRDHPVLAMVFTKLGEQGMEEAERDLGPVPSWARGSFKVGGSDDRPLIVNPAAISPFQTPAQVLATLRGAATGEAERSEQIGEFTAPAIQSGIEAAFGRDLFTGRELDGPVPERFAGQIAKGLPQFLLAERLRNAGKPETAEKAYPYSKGEALGQFIVGSSFPRPANLETLNAQAAGPKDVRGRVAERIDEERDELRKLIEAVDPEAVANGKLPPKLTKAFSRRQVVEIARAEIEKELKPGKEREAAKFDREVDILVRWKAMKPAEAQKARAWASKASLDDLEDARDYLVRTYFDDAYLGLIRDSRKYAEERQ